MWHVEAHHARHVEELGVVDLSVGDALDLCKLRRNEQRHEAVAAAVERHGVDDGLTHDGEAVERGDEARDGGVARELEDALAPLGAGALLEEDDARAGDGRDCVYAVVCQDLHRDWQLPPGH